MISKDGHEVCFVGDEAFRILSKEDSQADSLLSAVSILYHVHCMSYINVIDMSYVCLC